MPRGQSGQRPRQQQQQQQQSRWWIAQQQQQQHPQHVAAMQMYGEREQWPDIAALYEEMGPPPPGLPAFRHFRFPSSSDFFQACKAQRRDAKTGGPYVPLGGLVPPAAPGTQPPAPSVD
jgi:hypothetical protein